MSDINEIKELNDSELKKVSGGVTKVDEEKDIGRRVHVEYYIMDKKQEDYYGTLVGKDNLSWVIKKDDGSTDTQPMEHFYFVD